MNRRQFLDWPPPGNRLQIEVANGWLELPAPSGLDHAIISIG